MKIGDDKIKAAIAEKLRRLKDIHSKVEKGKKLRVADLEFLGLAENGDTADSMKQAAAATGISVRALQAAKNAGCGAFRGTRVYLTELQNWLAVPANLDLVSKHAGGTIETLETDILKERLRILRVKAETAEGLVIPVSEARRAFARVASTTKVKLQAIPASVAPLLGGRDIHEIEERIKAAIRDACEQIQNHQWNND